MRETSLFLYENISQILTCEAAAKKQGRNVGDADLGIIEDAAVVIDRDKNDEILWLGKTSQLPREYQDISQRSSGEGSVWFPEFVECHTHLIFAGDRSHDYALRAQGKTYQEVALAGGGILKTLRATREATSDELFDKAYVQLEQFRRLGVGTVEIKTGYGLSLESELRILEVIEDLQAASALKLVPTFLPAHAVPPEFTGRSDEYVDVICREWIPEVTKRGLAKFIDIFVEEGYFSVAQARKLGECGIQHGLRVKLHCDQFSDLGGTALGIELKAQSVDHLDNLSTENVRRLAQADTVAVLCPGASLYTKTPFAPARALIDAGARVALSTDFNPGTCPSRNLALMTTIACSQMKMTVPEAIAAITVNAAAALGLENEAGSLCVGRPLHAFQIPAPSYESLPYSFGELE